MQLTSRLQSALSRPFMPAVFFFAGVTYDTLTLSRIDRLFDNLILLLYLVLLGGLIVLNGRTQVAGMAGGLPETCKDQGPRQTFVARAIPYIPNAIQFLLGGLFSAYAIFYSQSASFSTTAIFFGVLVALLVANEFLRDRLSSVKLLVSLYTVVCFSFFTFFLPVLVRYMNAFIFLLGAFLSLAVALWVVELIYKQHPEVTRKERILTSLPAFLLISLLVGFYYLNWIPPVPLSLKFSGMYHQVSKDQGTYHLSFEKGAWYQFLKRSDDQFVEDERAYCFTAVFAPVDLKTTILHHWQHRSIQGRKDPEFVTVDKIPIRISGGRAKGYRAYTVKKRLLPGEWRVSVETGDGRVVGRVHFLVVSSPRDDKEAWDIFHY